jgi:hypothetical protein
MFFNSVFFFTHHSLKRNKILPRGHPIVNLKFKTFFSASDFKFVPRSISCWRETDLWSQNIYCCLIGRNVWTLHGLKRWLMVANKNNIVALEEMFLPLNVIRHYDRSPRWINNSRLVEIKKRLVCWWSNSLNLSSMYFSVFLS